MVRLREASRGLTIHRSPFTIHAFWFFAPFSFLLSPSLSRPQEYRPAAPDLVLRRGGGDAVDLDAVQRARCDHVDVARAHLRAIDVDVERTDRRAAIEGHGSAAA